MRERMTWNDIKTAYPEQWVVLSDVHYEPDNDAAVESAIVDKIGTPTREDYNNAFDGVVIVKYTTPDRTMQMGALRV